MASDTAAPLLPPLVMFDRLYGAESRIVVGIDEAGRGPLAGPVVAAAVVFNHPGEIPQVNDSKKLTEKKRDTLYDAITRTAAAWSVGSVSQDEIDRINILQATYKAMRLAVEGLGIAWDCLLVDGNRKIPQIDTSLQETIVGGDAKSAAIAAASIIAKVTRDRLMVEYDREFPQYQFKRHKGYGTNVHCACIKKYGLSTIHRKSFCSTMVLQTVLAL